MIQVSNLLICIISMTKRSWTKYPNYVKDSVSVVFKNIYICSNKILHIPFCFLDVFDIVKTFFFLSHLVRWSKILNNMLMSLFWHTSLFVCLFSLSYSLSLSLWVCLYRLTKTVSIFSLNYLHPIRELFTTIFVTFTYSFSLLCWI